MIAEPVIPAGARRLMTNSGKYAHYGPGLVGRGLRFAGIEACVEAACTGEATADPPAWLAGRAEASRRRPSPGRPVPGPQRPTVHSIWPWGSSVAVKTRLSALRPKGGEVDGQVVLVGTGEADRVELRHGLQGRHAMR